MVMPGHTCPYGLKSKWLLESKGYEVDDNYLTTREETDTFKENYGVKTTPQTWIDGQQIGGYTELRAFFGKPVDGGGKSYWPVGILFAMTALMAVGAAWVANAEILSILTAEWFVSFSMCLLAYLKLRDVEAFSTMFLNYDLLARRWVPYGYAYPWAEGLAGVLMTAHILPWLSIPVALFIGTIGAVSVFKAVYIEKRDLKCACVGGGNDVPLGFLSLTENLAMIGMAVWMLVKILAL
ncbi:glutaredoxin [Altererythrobacter endophyticus]|uniref:Methylamine utilization protein MauE n=2 Tax=Altericroceibacterium endophyticum TaxID=1808508 RepID=A0A6I4T1F3_9SPHN|nr:glutaredoxin [Altericroceibacterium endophyticum]